MLGALKGSLLRRRWLARRAPAGPMAKFYAAAWPRRATAARGSGIRRPRPGDHRPVAQGARDRLGRLGEDPRHAPALRRALPHLGQAEEGTDRGIGGHPRHHRRRPWPMPRRCAAYWPNCCRNCPAGLLIAHHAALEMGFLDRACRTCFGFPFEMPVVDTLDLERRTLVRREESIPAGTLRLDAVRGRYNLPRSRAHNALYDAIAAGELFSRPRRPPGRSQGETGARRRAALTFRKK